MAGLHRKRNKTAIQTDLPSHMMEWLNSVVETQAESGSRSPNHLWLAAMLLAEHDPWHARRLINWVLGNCREPQSGLILATSSSGDAQGPVAAWPLWSQVAECVCRKTSDEAWGQHVYPLLRQSFLAALSHFDPDRRGLPCWQSEAEAWDSRHYSAATATPDLAVLLLLEVDSLCRLHDTARVIESDPRLIEEREQLVGGTMEFLADSEHDCFAARRVGGGREALPAHLAAFPLLWPGLPAEWVGRLLMVAQAGLIPALASRSHEDRGTTTELWLWQRALLRLDALELRGELNRSIGPTPPAMADYAGSVALIGKPSRMRLMDSRFFAAAACLLLALGWGLGMREPVTRPDKLAIWRAEAGLSWLAGVDSTAELLPDLELKGVPALYLDWQRIMQAEMDQDWQEAVEIYRQLLDHAEATPPALFGMARAMGPAGESPQAIRQAWQSFLDQYGETFPDAASAAREIWWQSEQEWAGSGIYP